MYPVHGSICNTKTFPLNCKNCGSGIFFFQCDHGSRVLFDDLGPPWPIHHCGYSGTSPNPRPSSDEYFKNLQGVNLGVQSPNSGLLPGLRHGTVSISLDIVQRASETKSLSRETTAMMPYGSKIEHIQGVVTHVSRVSIADRYGIAPDTVAAAVISQVVGGLNIVQFTVLVDDYLNDPEAIDMMSYTVWCSVDGVSSSLQAGGVVEATIRPEEFMGIGSRWTAKSLERIL